ncbi:hypothetical protein AMECASPLE_021526 [Ameca splendens]|uniref:Uncharacterized protein n=1 Tax=Ameca splendens TaxID=208324 RepID=A0ABV0Z282_9TELE
MSPCWGWEEPELVREVERYRLEIAGFTSTHSVGSGTHWKGVAFIQPVASWEVCCYPPFSKCWNISS